MKNLVNIKSTVALSIAAMVVACGGGGGSSSSSSPTSLNLNAAYASLINGGNSVLYTLSGDCTGYSSQTYLPAYNFKNFATPAVEVLAVDKVQFDTLSSASQTSEICKQIFNSNNNEVDRVFYSPTNQTIVNSGGSGRYWKIYFDQAPLPTAVSAGSSGTLYTWKDYQGASSTDGNPVYSGSVTYSVAPDTATSLLVTITETGYEVSSNKLAYTVSDTYRLNQNNTLTSVSFSAKATENSPIKAAGSVVGTATPAITLDAQAIKVASLNAGSTSRYTVFDGSMNQCTPNMTVSTSALSSIAGTTAQGVAYAKSNQTTFNPSSLSGPGACSGFNFPLSEYAYFNESYSSVQETSNNSDQSSTNINASSVPLPTSATIGSNGQQYTFKRYSSSSPSTPFATGTSTYFVGAITPNKLAFFDVQTKNYTDANDYPGRQIFVNTAETNSSMTPLYGYINDGGRMYLIPTN